MLSRDSKAFQTAQQYSVDSASIYHEMATIFADDENLAADFERIASEKEMHAKFLQSMTGIMPLANAKEKNFTIKSMKFFGKKWMFKTFSGSEKNQAKLLKALAKRYPSLKRLQNEVEQEANEFMVMRNTYIAHKRKK